MNLIDVLKNNLALDVDAPEWKSTLLQLKVAIGYEPDKLECTGGFACKFTQSDLLDEKMFTDREGYVICADKGVILLAPTKGELPLVASITKKDIKAIESKPKFMKCIVTVRTLNHIYDFKTSKKDGAELEKELNHLRHV